MSFLAFISRLIPPAKLTQLLPVTHNISTIKGLATRFKTFTVSIKTFILLEGPSPLKQMGTVLLDIPEFGCSYIRL